MTFAQELRELLNKHSKEGKSNTPDLILAKYIMDCLCAYEEAVKARDQWWAQYDSDKKIRKKVKLPSSIFKGQKGRKQNENKQKDKK